MSLPILYGATGSAYVRSLRLALAEKNVPYRLEAMKFAEFKSQAHLARHPFGKVPAFPHEGFDLYETQAILDYVDAVFDGATLRPAEPQPAARMRQIMGLVDNYVRPSIADGILVNRRLAPRLGLPVDETAVAAVIPMAALCLKEIDRLRGAQIWKVGAAITLADLMVAPMLAQLAKTPEGEQLLGEQPRLAAWLEQMLQRPSMKNTNPGH